MCACQMRARLFPKLLGKFQFVVCYVIHTGNVTRAQNVIRNRRFFNIFEQNGYFDRAFRGIYADLYFLMCI